MSLKSGLGCAASRVDDVEPPAAGRAVREHEAAVRVQRRPALVARERRQAPGVAAAARRDDEVEALAGVGGKDNRTAVGRPGGIALDVAVVVGPERLAALAVRRTKARCDRGRRRPAGGRPATRRARARHAAARWLRRVWHERQRQRGRQRRRAAVLQHAEPQADRRTASTMCLAEMP